MNYYKNILYIMDLSMKGVRNWYNHLRQSCFFLALLHEAWQEIPLSPCYIMWLMGTILFITEDSSPRDPRTQDSLETCIAYSWSPLDFLDCSCVLELLVRSSRAYLYHSEYSCRILGQLFSIYLLPSTLPL